MLSMPVSGRHSNGKTLGELNNSKVGYFFNRSSGRPLYCAAAKRSDIVILRISNHAH